MEKQFESSFHHLTDLIKLFDANLNLIVHKSRKLDKIDDEFKGLYISDEEIDAILGDNTAIPHLNDNISKALIEDIKNLERSIKKREILNTKAEIKLAFPTLIDRFGLNSLEADILLFCIAVEIDGKYEKLYAYLHDDITRKRPTIGLITDVLCRSLEEKAKAYMCFYPQGTLFKNRLIDFCDSWSGGSWLSRPLEVNREVVAFLLGFDSHCQGNVPHQDVRPFEASGTFLPEGCRERVFNFLRPLGNDKGKATVHLQGPWGSGKREIAERVCRDIGISILSLDLQIIVDRGEDLEDAVSDFFLRAKLWDSAVYLQNFDALKFGEEGEAKLSSLVFDAIENFKGLIFLASKSPINLEGRLSGNFLDLRIPLPGYEFRKKIWASHLGDALAGESDQLANKFKFTPGKIRRAMAAAESQALSKGRSAVTKEDIYQGCRYQSSLGLSSFAVKIRPRYTLQDIVLPKHRLRQLKEIENHIKYRGLVYGEWGFGKKLSMGKGLNMLFSGPSGTGKTMAAEAIASDLQLDIYKIDLSAVVSKYIGETEKNLNRIFKEAELTDSILFFDEADALFGKRSDVKDSHDRYANIEVSYLLQKMEEHESITIMATNLVGSIDNAFLRRLHFTVEFPFPDEEQRLRIWRSLLPKGAPIAEDIDFEFLAKKLNISGGNIKNILVNAAFLAADNSKIIKMEDIVKATKREFQKMGKMCTQNDFEEYYYIISGR